MPLTVNSSSALAAKTADPTRVATVGERQMSTMPAASARGENEACSQPRSRGLAAFIASWRAWAASWVSSEAFSPTGERSVMGQGYGTVGWRGAPGCGDRHETGGPAV